MCLAGNCRVDADCGLDGYCSPTIDLFCGTYVGLVGYFCHTPHDACIDDADCPTGSDCRYDRAVSAWVCATGRCAG